MPIDAYVGKPGHGKSYGVVQHVIIPSLKQGRHVVTNIPLQVDMLLEDYPEGRITQLPVDWDKRDDLADLAPPGSVLILDELWRRWPSGLKATAVREQDKALLAEHRHRVDKNNKSMRIVLVTQDLSQIASFARALIEQTYRVVKKTKKAYRVDIYSGAATGDRPPKSQMQRQSFGTYKPEVYRYYKSATQSETGDVGDESKADNRGNIWRSPALWGLVVAIPVLVLPGVWGVHRFFDPEARGLHVQSELVNPPPAAAAPVQQVRASADRVVQAVTGVSVSGAAPMSATWRVAGWLGCSVPVEGDPSRVKPCGASVTGAGSVSRTSSVVLTDGSSRRIVPMAECRWIERDLYVLCDVDGERVTPWTGRGAVTKVVDPEASAQAQQSAGRSERSDQRPADAGPLSASVQRPSTPHATATVVTVVPDSEYASRPWRGQDD
jgi:zona occludens toxin